MAEEQELEVLLDTTGSPSQAEVVELVSQIATGVVLVWYSITELLAQLRRRKRLLRVVPPHRG